MKVGVKFCGHCNPLVDGTAILAEAKKYPLPVTYVGWEDVEKQALLILCGCLTGCARRPAFTGPIIVLTGSSLGGKPFPPDLLSAEIVERLRRALCLPADEHAPDAPRVGDRK